MTAPEESGVHHLMLMIAPVVTRFTILDQAHISRMFRQGLSSVLPPQTILPPECLRLACPPQAPQTIWCLSFRRVKLKKQCALQRAPLVCRHCPQNIYHKYLYSKIYSNYSCKAIPSDLPLHDVVVPRLGSL